MNTNNIFQVEYNQLEGIPKEFLDKVTVEKLNSGKKADNYWMLKTDIRLNTIDPSEQRQINTMNTFIQICYQKGFGNIMIINR